MSPRPPVRPTAARRPARPMATRGVPAQPRAALPEEHTPRWLPAWFPPRVYARLRQYALLTRQDRPVGWLLLLWPTYWGLWLAAEGTPPIATLVVFTLGVLLMRSAGCVINDYADRWLDPHVKRTSQRPIASGRVSPREALLVFGVLITLAFGLVLLTNRPTVYLSVVAAALAVVYPFLKRHTYVPQLMLGAAFGMAIPMAFTAVTGTWPPQLAWLAFAANVLWSTAYDTFYAMVDRDDDVRAGAKSTAILLGDMDLVGIAIMFASFVLAMALVGSRAGLGVYYWWAYGGAVLFIAWQLWIARSRTREAAFKAFRVSHWAGLILFAGIAVDYAARAG